MTTPDIAEVETDLTMPTEPRERTPVCPDWCAGHNGRYQGWDALDDGTTQRHHESEGDKFQGTTATAILTIDQVETLSPRGTGTVWAEPTVGIYVDSASSADIADLEPYDAEQLAMAVTEAVRAVEQRIEAQK